MTATVKQTTGYLSTLINLTAFTTGHKYENFTNGSKSNEIFNIQFLEFRKFKCIISKYTYRGT